ncbi:VOC family protein [Streptomyces yunnanensis]|uniref:VOC family protein n=1 Tax=Streptomyces yunnanensis TaxID=156453 RepID=UPI003B83029C
MSTVPAHSQPIIETTHNKINLRLRQAHQLRELHPTIPTPNKRRTHSVGALCGTLTNEVRRLVSLGAKLLDDEPSDLRSVMMPDPEGHPFKVELSEEELLDEEAGPMP